MRTTIDIADDVLAAARTLAAERNISLGAAMSDLARRGLRAGTTSDGELPVFEVGADAPPITPEMVDAALDE
ncbi:MAG: antitoxin [Actinomycetota bacterium]|nr:antitoxin [Actinomycetota bacterium]